MPAGAINLDEVSAAVGYFDAQERSVYANAAAGLWFGMSPDEMRGRYVREIVGEGPYRARLPHIEAVLRDEVDEFDGSLAYHGTVRRVCMTLSPHLMDGQVVGFFASTIDLDLVGEGTSTRALHDSLVAALTEQEHLAELSAVAAEARIVALVRTAKEHLAEVCRRLGVT